MTVLKFPSQRGVPLADPLDDSHFTSLIRAVPIDFSFAARATNSHNPVVLAMHLSADELEHAVTRRCAWLGDRCSMREALGAFIFHRAYASTSQLAHRAARLVIP